MVVLSVIPSGVEESQLYLLNISTDSPETVRDFSTSLEMTNVSCSQFFARAAR